MREGVTTEVEVELAEAMVVVGWAEIFRIRVFIIALYQPIQNCIQGRSIVQKLNCNEDHILTYGHSDYFHWDWK
ncbi:hypothetical protein VNO80_25928 [Phaseolus coccineus]|uniref:Uncharacterized protein n=1 Tax=Phaseolus coccineus TaxID=3886 RepID=A0AAN9LYQ4_PHACN